MAVGRVAIPTPLDLDRLRSLRGARPEAPRPWWSQARARRELGEWVHGGRGGRRDAYAARGWIEVQRRGGRMWVRLTALGESLAGGW
jgi:hypothetical protein